MRVTIEWLCPHGYSTWHYIGLQYQSATCTRGRREVKWISK